MASPYLVNSQTALAVAKMANGTADVATVVLRQGWTDAHKKIAAAGVLLAEASQDMIASIEAYRAAATREDADYYEPNCEES